MNAFASQPFFPLQMQPFQQIQQNVNVVLNFYGEKKRITLPDTFEQMITSFPSLLPVEYHKSNNQYMFSYEYYNSRYIITSQQDYVVFWNLARTNFVSELLVEIKSSNNNVINQQPQLNPVVHPQQIQQQPQQMVQQIQQQPQQMVQQIQQQPQQIQPSKTYTNTITNAVNQNIPANNNQQKQNVQEVIFDVGCKECSAYPIYGTIFRCLKCKFFICAKCETTFGEKHPHALIKIRNHTTMKDSDFLAYTNSIMFSQIQQPQVSSINQSQLIQKGSQNENVFVSNMKQIPGKLMVIPEKIKGFISGANDTENQQERAKKIASMNPVQQMRVLYSLSNFTDAQIENALRQTNFIKEEAILLLLK